MSTKSVLVVDDEREIQALLSAMLGRMGLKADGACNLAEARDLLEKKFYNLCITDMRMPGGSGLELIGYIRDHHPDMPVAMLTAYGDVESAVTVLKAGAFDYVSKPINSARLRDIVDAALRLSDPQRPGKHVLVGESPAIEVLRTGITKLARNQAPILITGESGTGKELVARLIHEQGPRGQRPFIAVNCGAIPDQLMESEFFGYKKGSFTGAVSDKGGLFEAAHRGTLLLDEISELPLPMQVKLLRVIQEKVIRPIGGHHEVSVDFRILCATNRNLAAMTQSGGFREDLYYRINVIELYVPTLRERTEDIPLLTDRMLAKLAKKNGRSVPKLGEGVLDALIGYSFPGNVRELENILERALTLCEHDVIQVQDLALGNRLRNRAVEESVRGVSQNVDDPLSKPLEILLEEQQKEAILGALEKTRYNKTAAAKLLGVSYRSLRYRIRKYRLE